jgi:hypothetical protein
LQAPQSTSRPQVSVTLAHFRLQVCAFEAG